MHCPLTHRNFSSTWNKQFSPDHTEVSSVLQDIQTFSGKADILYALTSFALRCRAFWDKYLGILFLLYDKENYDNYTKAKSRKRAFQRLASTWPEISPLFEKCLGKNISDLAFTVLRTKGLDIKRDELPTTIPFPEPFIEVVLELIEELDKFRVPEAHGAGRLRKWTLSMVPLDKARDFALINHWNIANEFMHALEEVLGNLAITK